MAWMLCTIGKTAAMVWEISLRNGCKHAHDETILSRAGADLDAQPTSDSSNDLFLTALKLSCGISLIIDDDYCLIGCFLRSQRS
jgi:hypothetical protein